VITGGRNGYAPGVPRIDELMEEARDLTEEVSFLAQRMLARDEGVQIVHGDYVVPAIELLAGAERHAILASADDQDALREVEQIVSSLIRLRDRTRDQDRH
jgi:hypothetical protein